MSDPRIEACEHDWLTLPFYELCVLCNAKRSLDEPLDLREAHHVSQREASESCQQAAKDDRERYRFGDKTKGLELR